VTEERSGCAGGLLLALIMLLGLGGLWVAAAAAGWPRDRVLWIGIGSMLAVLTLARPWWFWDNYKARWLRDAVGDEATAAFYLAVAAAMIWVGCFTDWPFGRR
jgi:hypothetical protein